MTDRQRIRRGRSVNYFPTAGEVAAFGDGPYSATVTQVADDGTVSLNIDVPPGASLAGTIDTTYAQDPEGDILEELRTREQLKTQTGISRGETAGTFSLLGTGPQAL